MIGDLLGYAAIQVRNRETFLLNFGNDFRTFEFLLDTLRSVWARLGKERDNHGRSHAGLLVFANVLARHAMFGFQHIASYQSFLAWLTFRPGLEALLILGKLVDDPVNAHIWKQRHTDRNAYQKTFSGQALVSRSLPRSADFREVLTHLNDDFVHPNPDFTYRDMTVQDQGLSLALEIQFFDTTTEVHEAHLLAYLNLLDVVLHASEDLVNALCGPSSENEHAKPSVASVAGPRAATLATRNLLAKKVMEELGLWQF